MLQPKRTKYRKQQKGNLRGVAARGSSVSFGDFALQSTEQGFLTARQIEAGRMAIQRHCKRAGKLYIRVFPDKPITKKPLETRMGTGKGNVEWWVCVIQPGRVLFEISGVTQEMASEAFRLASHKLPVSTAFLSRSEQL
jgi:large subunit ribosomal protein L16